MTENKARARGGIERITRIRDALNAAGLDAIVCALPHDVLLVSGYWPVTGRSIAVVNADGESALVVPKDEQKLANRGWVDNVVPFAPPSERRGSHAIEPLQRALKSAVSAWPRIHSLGFEDGPSFVPAPYAALCVYGPSYLDTIVHTWPEARLVRAEGVLADLRARPTQFELSRIRVACRLASRAFVSGCRRLHAGLRETTLANWFRGPLHHLTHAHRSAVRAGGYVFCMSGPNAERAAASYQHSSKRRTQPGEPLLIHCNSFVDGYWTDITRTFCLGEPAPQLRAAFEAVLAARDAALSTIRAGVNAANVDKVARNALDERGFGSHVRHPLGHGVGFAAIDHNALPQLAPDSRDVLQAGMVMNVEPGVYGGDIGGVRHCDVVCVTDEGHELLTPFLTSADELIRPSQVSLADNRPAIGEQ